MCGRLALTETDRDLVAADLASRFPLRRVPAAIPISRLQSHFVIIPSAASKISALGRGTCRNAGSSGPEPVAMLQTGHLKAVVCQFRNGTDGMDPAPLTERPLQGQDGKLDQSEPREGGGSSDEGTTIGIDLAKDVFGLHGVRRRTRSHLKNPTPVRRRPPCSPKTSFARSIPIVVTFITGPSSLLGSDGQLPSWP